MFAVRIERNSDESGWIFTVSESTATAELVALDSTPAVIAFVREPDPGKACAVAWRQGQAEIEYIRSHPKRYIDSPAALLDAMMTSHTMSPEDLEEQRRSFAFGNANIENPLVTRELVDQVADAMKEEPNGA